MAFSLNSAGCDGRAVRVAIVTESFLPQVNGVTNSVLRVVEHLERRVTTPWSWRRDRVPDRYRHAEVRRVRAVDLPVISSLPIGVPSPKVHAALAEFAPDVVHLASPFVLGAAGLQIGPPARRADGRRLPDRRGRVRRRVRAQARRAGGVAVDPQAAQRAPTARWRRRTRRCAR